MMTVIALVAGASVAAGTEIHRCVLEDGTVAFQEMPCPERADSAADAAVDQGPVVNEAREPADNEPDYVNPFDEPVTTPAPVETSLTEPASHDRTECEATTRDAIEALDLEMRQQAETKEQRQEYLSELLLLTKQLRACKEL